MHDAKLQVDPDPLPPARPVAWVTWAIIASTIAVFLVQLAVYVRTGEDGVGDALAFSPQAWSEHRYWTILTYGWAHAVAIFNSPWLFWLHIGGNLMALAWFGPAVEELLGRWLFAGLYLGGEIVSALLWLWVTPSASAADGIIGASGAICAVIAALGALAPSDWEMVIYPFTIPLGRKIRLVVIAICLVEVIPLSFNWMPEIAHSAHLGGALFGFLYVLLFYRAEKTGFAQRTEA
jgi:membrane associated rhomboid family serine protease